MKNFFEGFKLFAEKESKDPTDAKDSMVSILKKQLGIPKKVWVGMPLLISNAKIGDQMIREPTMFYVSDYDDTTVTLKNVKKLGDVEDEDSDYDPDAEIDLDKTTIHGSIEFTISIDDFYELQKPQGMQAGGGGGGLGGLGGLI